MKSKLIQSFMGLTMLFMMASCSIHKSSMVNRKQDALQARDQETCCFVQWQDNTISVFESLELVTGVFKTPMLLADGEIKIYPSQIKAYQNKHHYAVSQNEIVKARKTFVASETLPGFAIRVAKGKFNVYAKKVHNGQHSADEFYIQEGDQGKIYACTDEVMNGLLQTDPDSFDMIYASMTRSGKNKKIQSLATLAKTNKGLTKNK